jgi:hypothetical protein
VRKATKTLPIVRTLSIKRSLMMASIPRDFIILQVSRAASEYLYIHTSVPLAEEGEGNYFAIKSDVSICVMIEVFHYAFHGGGKTF